MTEPVQALLAEVQRDRRLTSVPVARDLRKAAGLTQQRLAAALGVDRSTLARWESGAAKPRESERRLWVRVLEALQQEAS